MEHGLSSHPGAGKDENSQGEKVAVAANDAEDVTKPRDGLALNAAHPKVQENAESHELKDGKGSSGDVNMEASISPDDVLRAGGLGARDDISSFLPVASDTTDFEASIRDAREYEEPQGQTTRPGLGWGRQ